MRNKKVVFLMKLVESHANNYAPAVFNWYGILEYLGYDVEYFDYSNYQPEEFYKKIKEEKPDFVFHPTYEDLHIEFFRLSEFTKVYLLHSDDDWRFDSYAKYWIPFTAGAIGYQNRSESYESFGAPKNYYFRSRYVFNPSTMRFNFSSRKEYDFTHLGGLHGTKSQKIEALKALGFNITTINPNFTSYSYYMECYHKSKISLCLTGNSLNGLPQSKTRLSEMPYYCVMASEPWPDMEMWNMEPNKDFILIDEKENWIEILNRCLVDEDYRNNMYASAKSILINSNTVFNEWDKIMQHIDPDYDQIDVHKLVSQFEL